MSLILEALRKSEAERQLGRLPGLMSPTQQLQRRRSRWPQLAAGAFAVVVLVAGAWWVGRAGSPTPAADSTVVGPAGVAAPTASATAPAATTPSATIKPPAPAPTGPDAPVAAASHAPNDDGRDAAPARIVTVPSTPTAAPATAEPIAATPSPATATKPAPTTIEPIAPPVAEPPEAAAAAVPEPAFPSLAQMRPEQRQSLPALKLSVHVFNADPSARFAVVDGRRVREGEDLGSGVRIREIRRDGLLLDVSGQPWLLAR